MADKIFAGDEDEQAPNAPALAALLDLDKKIEAEASCLPARSFVSRLLHLFGVWRTRSTLTLTARPTSAASAGARGGPGLLRLGRPGGGKRAWVVGVCLLDSASRRRNVAYGWHWHPKELARIVRLRVAHEGQQHCSASAGR